MRRGAGQLVLSLALLVVAPSLAVAQQHAHGTAATIRQPGGSAFLADAKRGTARYRSLDSAIVDGYRQIGGDLPSLGEHWIHPGRVMSGRVDADRPSVLIYVRTPQGPRLAGVAWTTVLRAGEPYPEQPVGAGAWHEHNGTVDEETLPFDHHGRSARAENTRVAILHAWVWVENPDGVWRADNWALPFVRAGLRPGPAPIAAARALGLTAPGAVEYYERAVAASVAADSALLARTRAALTEAAAAAAAVRHRASDRIAAADVHHLARIWDELWARLTAEASAAHGDALRHLADALR